MKNITKKLYKLEENFCYFKLLKRKLYAMLIEAKDNWYKEKQRKEKYKGQGNTYGTTFVFVILAFLVRWILQSES